MEEVLKNRWIDPAFDYTINNATKPLELEKAYALMESKFPSKSAPPPKIDPQTGERINAGSK